MSAARERILGRLRRGLGREALAADRAASLAVRLAQPPQGPVPARAQLQTAERVTLFETLAREQTATVERLAELRTLPNAVARYLASHNLPARIALAPTAELANLPWGETGLTLDPPEAAREDGAAALTLAFAGIAETGTLMLVSGPATPTGINFLPDSCLVVLKQSALVGPFEEALKRLRAAYGPGQMPRTVNFITGPSRTADIEQTIQMGAHGPRRLHILLLEDEAVGVAG